MLDRGPIKLTERMSPPDEAPVIVVGSDIADLVPPFLQNRKDDLERLKQALSGGDWTTVRRIGHGMKGTGGAYGAPAISAWGKRFEVAAHERNQEEVITVMTELEAFLSHIRVEVS